MKGLVAFGSSSRSPNAAEPSKGPKPYANAALNLVNVYYIKYSSFANHADAKKSVIRRSLSDQVFESLLDAF